MIRRNVIPRRCGLEQICPPLILWRRDDSSTCIGSDACRSRPVRPDPVASDAARRPEPASSLRRPNVGPSTGAEREAPRRKPAEPRPRHRAALRMRAPRLSGDLPCRRRQPARNSRPLHRRPCPRQRRHSGQRSRPFFVISRRERPRPSASARRRRAVPEPSLNHGELIPRGVVSIACPMWDSSLAFLWGARRWSCSTS